MSQDTTIQYAILATDVAIFRLRDDRLEVLLVKPKAGKFPGKYALPGGLVQANEQLDISAFRFYTQVISMPKHYHIEQLYTFGDPNRDPSGRVVSVAYLALVPSDTQANHSTDAFPELDWFDVKTKPALAYDHEEVLKEAISRLQGKLSYTNLAYALLPEEFTLTQLQKSYETILGETLDKRNFRKKIKSLKLLKELTKMSREGAHRPAKLFAFKSLTPQIISVL